MATLARDLQNRGIRLEDPYQENKEVFEAFEREQAAKEPQVEEEEEEEDEDEEYEEESHQVDFDLDEYFEEESEGEEVPEVIATMSSRRAIVKTTPKRRTKPVSTDTLASQMASLSMGRHSLLPISGDLSCPMLSGRWEMWDFDTETSTAYILMRMVIIDGVKSNDDFQLCFTDKRTFRIRMKWPKFMQKCMMMTSLDIAVNADGIGRESFPAGHKVYEDMAKGAKSLKDDSGCIWSEGLFQFKNDMETNMFEPQIFQIPDGGGTVLQVKFTEAAEETDSMPFGSPIYFKTAGSNMSSKSLGKRPERTSFTSMDLSNHAAEAAAEVARLEEAAQAAAEVARLAEAAAAAAAAADGFESSPEPSSKRNKTTHIPPPDSQIQVPRVPLGKKLVDKWIGVLNNKGNIDSDPDL